MTRGRKTVAAGIETAPPAPASVNTRAKRPPAHIARRFDMREDGLYRRTADDDKPPLWICDPFAIEAETTTEDGRGWGLLLRWANRDGNPVSEVFARSLFAGECGELRARLADGGLGLNNIQLARAALAEYLNVAGSADRVRVVTRTGWHRIGDARVFVLHDEVFGTSAERVMLQPASRDPSTFNTAGTLPEWRDAIAAPSASNTRLAFAIACAFAGPLLDLLGEDGGGFHLRGKAQIGKTTALRVAASVWGGTPGPGAGGFISTWRATTNGIEGIAAAHSDALLLLDEMGSADGREIGGAAYMLANGQGKTRSDRTGASRTTARWRTLFLSTGELALQDKATEGGQRTYAGQEVRLVTVAADTGAHGLFDDLAGHRNAAALATTLRDASRRLYGVSGRAYLRWLASRLVADPDYPSTLRAELDRLTGALLRHYPDAGGQVRSVARRFALVWLAGQLATDATLTGWRTKDVRGAVGSLFRDWLEDRGTTGAAEDLAAVRQLRGFISKHRESRFTIAERPDSKDDFEDDTQAPGNRFHVQNAAGWRMWETSADPEASRGWTYYFDKDGMHEALAGLAFKDALRALVIAGVLVGDGAGKTSISGKLPGMAKKMRLYRVPGTVLGVDDEADPPTATDDEDDEVHGD